jgi:glycosyltransferase involved in cell wall biosynthesis
VLFVSSADHPGADTFIHMLVMRSLDRSQYTVHVAGPAPTRHGMSRGYEVLTTIPDIHLRPANFGPSMTGRTTADTIAQAGAAIAACASFAGLARYVRRHDIRVLHSTDRPRDAVACVLLARLTGARAVIHAHLKCAEWMSGSLRWAMSRADALVAVSAFVARSLVDGGYPPDRVHPVLNAIDFPVWDPALDGSAVRREFGIAPTAPVIACAARLFRGKGQEHVIAALPALRAEFPDIRVLIMGRDDRQAMKTSFTAELRELAARLGVSGHVIFTGHRPDMPALIAASDLFALPSLEEPFGLVFAEAMAMKKPVVALDSGGAPEIVDHGKSGLLSSPGDHEMLTANLLTLLRDPALRARMGEYGRRQVERRFTADRMAADISRVYASLLPSHASRELPVRNSVAL